MKGITVMTTEKAKILIDDFGFHTRLIHQIIDDVTQEESLLQPPFEANCLNWVLGHIITNRSHTLEAIGVNHTWQEEVRKLYDSGTEPVKADSKSIRMDVLLQFLDQSQTLTDTALENMSDDFLNSSFINYRGEKTRFDHASGFHWHETFHIGQLDLLKAMVVSNRKKQP